MLNPIKTKLSQKHVFAGCTLMLGSTRAAEIMARSGFDFLMIDLQHGSFGKASATDSIRSVATSPTIPFARVSDNTSGAVNDVLDAGALGVVVPMIETREQAEAAVRHTFYSPKGQRSKGAAATSIYSEDYHRWANDAVLLTIMIETVEGVDRADEILSVPGIDMCLLGTSDLALDMNCSRDSSEIEHAFRRVEAAGRKNGVRVGAAIASPHDVRRYMDFDVAFFLISHDHGLLRDASRHLSGELASAIQGGRSLEQAS